MKTRYLLAPLFLLAILVLPAQTADDLEIYRLVTVRVDSLEQIRNVQSLGVEIIGAHPGVEVSDGSILIVAVDRDLRDLDALEYSYEVVIEDMAAHYAKVLAESEPGPRDFPYGSMGGYLTNAEVIALLDTWASQYPNLISSRMSIGTTIQGRDIWAVKISDNPNVDENEPECSFDSLIHAREPAGMATSIYYMQKLLEGYGIDPELTYLVDSREIWFIPVHNPDGYVYNEQNYPGGGGMWRKNRRQNAGGSYGVDLNRNYGFMWGYDNYGSSPYASDEDYRGTSAFSEPETQAVRDFLSSRPIATAWNTHTYADLYLCPFGYDNVLPYGNDWPTYQEYLDDISAENGYVAGPVYSTIYAANGGAVDWHYGDQGIFGLSPEIGGDDDGGFWPPQNRIVPLAEENYPAIKYWTWVAGSYVLLDSHAFADENGDGLFHPGEPIDVTLTLRNKGLAATAGNVVATMTSSSPYGVIVDGAHNFGTIASVTNADNNGSPLRVELKDSTPYGEVVAFDVNVSFDGFVLSLPITVTCGVPSVLAAFDMEANPGWTVGDTGDNATAGIWTRADPIGTSYGGEQIQPENDHTAAPGVQCWVTGNGSSDPGGDDVDSGKTTLKTALIDLSGLSGVEISYWRWFADLGSTPNDDIFQVDISNDAGATWTNAESLDHTINSWAQVAFNVSDFVTPTDEVMMRFIAKDEPNNSLCEAAVDDFEVRTYAAPISLELLGTPAVGTTVHFAVESPQDAGLKYVAVASRSTWPPVSHSGVLIPVTNDNVFKMSREPGSKTFTDFTGFLNGAGYSQAPAIKIPNNPNLIGTELFVAAVTLNPGGPPPTIKNVSAPLYIVIQ